MRYIQTIISSIFQKVNVLILTQSVVNVTVNKIDIQLVRYHCSRVRITFVDCDLITTFRQSRCMQVIINGHILSCQKWNVIFIVVVHYLCAHSSELIRSGAAADRRTPLKPGAQLDLASPYAVPRTRRTESPTSLNYAKLCVELIYTGAAIGEMWGDLVIRHIVLE